MRTLLALSLLLISISAKAADAQSAADSSVATSPRFVPEESPIDHHKNYFGVSLSSSPTGGFSYARRITDQFLLGATLAGGQGNSSNKEGGSLDDKQYYKESSSQSAQYYEVNGTYYFREEGAKRWGFLARSGIGYVKREEKANWERYERETGWLGQLFNIDKHQIDSGDVKSDWSTAYARVGGAYQFLWQRHTDALIVGHILEIGVNGLIPQRRGSISYTKPNGEVYSKTAPQLEPFAEVAYKFIF